MIKLVLGLVLVSFSAPVQASQRSFSGLICSLALCGVGGLVQGCAAPGPAATPNAPRTISRRVTPAAEAPAVPQLPPAPVAPTLTPRQEFEDRLRALGRGEVDQAWFREIVKNEPLPAMVTQVLQANTNILQRYERNIVRLTNSEVAFETFPEEATVERDELTRALSRWVRNSFEAFTTCYAYAERHHSFRSLLEAIQYMERAQAMNSPHSVFAVKGSQRHEFQTTPNANEQREIETKLARAYALRDQFQALRHFTYRVVPELTQEQLDAFRGEVDSLHPNYPIVVRPFGTYIILDESNLNPFKGIVELLARETKQPEYTVVEQID